jgi:hypothetical protein
VSFQGSEPHAYTVNGKPGETRTVADRVSDGPMGKLRVAAAGGFCDVRINGNPYGVTPVEAMIPLGPVKVLCTSPTGVTQTQFVTVTANDAARAWFKIGE